MERLGLPNLISLVRMALVAPVAWLLVDYGVEPRRGMRWATVALFALTAGTDFVDGWVARRLNQRTPLGRLLDPLADKLLLSAVMLVLVAYPVADETAPGLGRSWRPPVWVVAAAVFKDAAVSVAWLALRHRPAIRNIGPRAIGKACTFVQMAAVLSTLLAPELPAFLADRVHLAWVLAGGLALAALLDYVLTGLRIRNGRPSAT